MAEQWQQRRQQQRQEYSLTDMWGGGLDCPEAGKAMGETGQGAGGSESGRQLGQPLTQEEEEEVQTFPRPS